MRRKIIRLALVAWFHFRTASFHCWKIRTRKKFSFRSTSKRRRLEKFQIGSTNSFVGLPRRDEADLMKKNNSTSFSRILHGWVGLGHHMNAQHNPKFRQSAISLNRRLWRQNRQIWGRIYFSRKTNSQVWCFLRLAYRKARWLKIVFDIFQLRESIKTVMNFQTNETNLAS